MMGGAMGRTPDQYTKQELISAYYAWARTYADDVAWASDDVFDAELRMSPDELWLLVLDFVNAAPDPLSLGAFSAGPLEDLMRRHGALLIDRVESEAKRNPRLREALAGIWIGEDHVGHDVLDRIHAAAESHPGNWPIGDAGLPIVVEQLLASERIEDRRWGTKQLGQLPYTSEVRDRLVDALHSGDEEMREEAASSIALNRDVSLLPDVAAEVEAHSGRGGGTTLAWADDWLSHEAGEDELPKSLVRLGALAERGDEQMKARVHEIRHPEAAVADFQASSEQLLEEVDEVLTASEFMDGLAPDVRAQLKTVRDELEATIRRTKN